MNVSAPRPQVSVPASVSFSAQVNKPEAKSVATGSSSPQRLNPFARDSFECANGKCGPNLSGGAAVDAKANTEQTRKLDELLNKVLKGGSSEEVRNSLDKLLEALGIKPQGAGKSQDAGQSQGAGKSQGSGSCSGAQGSGSCNGANASGDDILSQLMKLLQENPEMLAQLLKNPQAQQDTSASPVGELSGISRFQGSSSLQLAA